ncbi:hypothetical protein SS209_03234 [Salmonella enterica subsp. enterica serovar Senftenberg str. SS209]|nr:hypothetical protein SS209_03234 [Salmonella enterica subsp. enterica serovar Senftenberg str. SS209]
MTKPASTTKKPRKQQTQLSSSEREQKMSAA